jgi:hypothetical protein
MNRSQEWLQVGVTAMTRVVRGRCHEHQERLEGSNVRIQGVGKRRVLVSEKGRTRMRGKGVLIWAVNGLVEVER